MIVVAFASTHDALEIEDALMENNIDLRTIPTPREISAGCGISLKLNMEHLEYINKILKEHDIINKQIFNEIVDEGKKTYKLIE